MFLPKEIIELPFSEQPFEIVEAKHILPTGK